MPAYGVGGAAINIATPYLIPFLKAEIGHIPKELTRLFKTVDSGAQTSAVRRLNVQSSAEATKIPISTPNKRYEAYLRSQGYEPYIPDNKLPSIDVGTSPANPALKNAIDPSTNAPRVFDANEAASRAAGYDQLIVTGKRK